MSRCSSTIAIPDHPNYPRFDVSTATRAGSVAEINNFCFSNAALPDYEEEWLFGDGREQSRGRVGALRSPDLSSAETAALDNFMDSHCGVFATGDDGRKWTSIS